MFSSDDTENLDLGTRVLAAFDQFSTQPHTLDEYKAFYDNLVDTSINMPWTMDWYHTDKWEQRFWAPQRVAELEDRYLNQQIQTDPYTVGEIKEVNGVKREYIGNNRWKKVKEDPREKLKKPIWKDL